MKYFFRRNGMPYRMSSLILVMTITAIWLIFANSALLAAEAEEPVSLEPIVVTATRTEESPEKIASSVTVITAEEIEKSRYITAKETLRRVPGLALSSQGGLGRTSSVFIRGARSEDTLVMIDGMEINDPINPGRFFNFADLTTNNIQQIEVVRGPQSPLYGSDAMGGVINIITKRGQGPPEFSLFAEGGSHATFREILESSGAAGPWDYSFSAGRIDSDGIGSDDDYDNTSLSGRMGFQLSEQALLEFFFRALDAETHLDDWDFMANESVNDPNFVQDTDFQLYQGRYTQEISDLWESILRVGYFDNDRQHHDRPDEDEDVPGYFSEGDYEGTIFDVDWQHNLYANERNTLTFGIEYETESGESEYRDYFTPDPSRFPEESVHTWGYYVQNQFELTDRLYLTAGIRLDDHQEFGSEETYKLGAAYHIPQTKTRIKGTLGTGFKAPTLYQLYTPPILDYNFLGGNPDLDPEESESYDIGIEQILWHGRVWLSAVYFNNEYDDYITYTSEPDPDNPDVFVSFYDNLSGAESKGWELEIRYDPTESVSFYGTYTYTDTENDETGGDLLRIPEDMVSIIMDYTYGKKLVLTMGLYYVSDRLDIGNEETDDYTRADFAATYTLSDSLQLHGRIENLFDQEYEESVGYDAPGFSAFGGVKVTF